MAPGTWPYLCHNSPGSRLQLVRLQWMLQEFPARPRSYYEQAFADGRIRVEKRKGVGATTPLDGREQLRHFVHRHEPPVLDLPIEVGRHGMAPPCS